jgi:hypothetical protein
MMKRKVQAPIIPSIKGMNDGCPFDSSFARSFIVGFVVVVICVIDSGMIKRLIKTNSK